MYITCTLTGFESHGVVKHLGFLPGREGELHYLVSGCWHFSRICLAFKYWQAMSCFNLLAGHALLLTIGRTRHVLFVTIGRPCFAFKYWHDSLAYYYWQVMFCLILLAGHVLLLSISRPCLAFNYW